MLLTSKHLNASTITSKQLPENEEELLLVIGIKTAVAANFVIRQAIRQTWARKQVLPVGVKAFLLGCRPRANTGSDDDDWNDDSTSLNRLMEAVELEKMLYGDLLTDELDCEDSYEGLAKKVKQFLHFVAINYARAKYVMIADDDLYVRMDKVVHKLKTMAPPVRFYTGQVRAIENAQKETPIRVKNPKLRYALSKDQFPMSVLPPFALGAYVFLSMDCVLFVSKNRKRLHDLSGMDDMSIALWLLSIQVHPQPFRQLEHLRGGPCNNDLVTIGDLSPLSIRLVHDNLLAQRAMCHGFNHHIWLKPASLAPSRTHCSELPYTRRL
ncbi:unnamed protein product [Phytophthora lilii]|uniref:Hexosyltransferase n=1 Tax=Phytophthora lilii TaxID=2077276 RepID=A0A9W6TV67_9STRA|nr:unnamed protein product [Phytophthora lilii]